MEKLKKRILSKRFLYILCFMVLNFIEYLKATQTGNIWHVAVNCMGLVTMVIVASAYPLKKFVSLSNAVYTVLCIAAMVAVYFHWRAHYGEYYVWQVETAILNIWWIGIIVKHLFRQIVIDKTKAFRPNILGWLWIALSILMICSVSGRLWPLWYLLMFGAFYLTEYAPDDRKALWDGMIDGTIVSFFCIQTFAYGFRPYDTVRYTGAFANCNMMALYYLIVYMMVLYKLHILQMKGAHKGWKLFYLVGAGGLLCFQLLTMGRTAWITSFVVTFLYGVLVIRKLWKKKWYQVIARGGALVLAAVITFLPVFYTVRWLPTILHYRIWYEGEYSVDKVHSFDPPDSEKYVELDEFLEALLGRIANTLKKADARNPFVLRAYASELERVDLVKVSWTEDEALRIRMTIYKAYLNDLTWYGNGQNTGYYLIGEGDYHSWHAQNLWLQIAYYFGIPSGILLIVLSVVMVYYYGKLLIKQKTNPYAIIPFFMCVLCFTFGMMEVVWNPGQLIMFLIFFVQHPQLGRNGESERC
ncbi:MAG: hypothetical protein ACI4TB_11595 [Lachnospiraceae bacterium]